MFLFGSRLFFASGAIGEKDGDCYQEEEEGDQNETPMIRASEVFCLTNQIGCDKQTDARAGRDDPES